MATNPRIASIERATGRTWDEWLTFMEGINAKDLNHHDIALKVFDELNTGKIENFAWWVQSVTVAYEQFIGRRIPGQRPDGTFQTSVIKATQLGMQELMDAWVDFAAKDKDVLAMITDDVRVGGTEKRLSWRAKGADGSTVLILSEPKAHGTASLVVQNMGLLSNELNIEAKEKWTAIVGRFAQSL